jgi:signal transduction histidine kinase
MMPADPSNRSGYRWWPRYRPGTVELGGAGPRELARTAGSVLAITGVLALPPIARATGLGSVRVIILGLVYVALMAMNDLALHPAAMKSRRWFNAQLVIVPIYNVAICALVIVIPGDPKSPLWMALLVYACTTSGWQEIDASIPFLLFHALAPLLTIPVFLARGADPAWSIAGPLLCGLMSGLAYHVIASNNATWRRVRAEQAETIAELRRRAAELERGRIARDLHDSVGSVLGLVGLYGDLVERHAHRPEELYPIARTLREATREGLDELRGVLDALAPDASDVRALASTLRRSGERVAAASGAAVSVSSAGDEDRALDGPERLAVVRIFQEAVNNALRHGHARSIDVRLTGQIEWILLEVTDDGDGFETATADSGRGLVGMRARTTELGGAFELISSLGAGARVRVQLPSRRSAGAAG